MFDANAPADLKVTASISFGLTQVSEIIADYLVAEPDTRLQWRLADATVDLLAEGYDLAIRIGLSVRDDRLAFREIGLVRRVLCASPAYLDRHGRPERPQDLAGHVCMTFGGAEGKVTWDFEGPEPTSVTVPTRYGVNSGIAERDAAIAGVGIARLPTFVAGEALADGRLEQVLPSWSISTLKLFAAWPAASEARVAGLVELLATRFADPAPWDRAVIAAG